MAAVKTEQAMNDQSVAAAATNNQALLKLTSTVQHVLDRYPADEAISAAVMADTILDSYDHRANYADGIFASNRLTETDEKRPVSDWIDGIQTLFNRKSLEAQGHEPLLHGRLALIGLALLDQSLYQQMITSEAFQRLVDDLSPPLAVKSYEDGYTTS